MDDLNNTNEVKKSSRYLGDFIFILIISAFVLLWIFLGFKAFIFSCGLASLFMYVTITATNISNAFISRVGDPKIDLFWRYLFSFIATICFTLTIYL